MSAIAALVARRATETITVASVTGHSSAGDPTYAAQRTMPARIERNASRSADAEGERDSPLHKVFTSEQLVVGDLVWLPEADTADQNQAVVAKDVTPERALDGSATHWATIAG